MRGERAGSRRWWWWCGQALSARQGRRRDVTKLRECKEWKTGSGEDGLGRDERGYWVEDVLGGGRKVGQLDKERKGIRRKEMRA